MNKEDFLKIFNNMITKIEERVKLYAFVIFGSRARGDFLQHSDYDIVIIADFQEKYLDRSEWIIHQTAPILAMDVFCYTPEEFDQMFTNYRLTAIDVIDEGIALKGDRYLLQYREKLEEFKKRGLRKEDNILYPPKST